MKKLKRMFFMPISPPEPTVLPALHAAEGESRVSTRGGGEVERLELSSLVCPLVTQKACDV